MFYRFVKPVRVSCSRVCNNVPFFLARAATFLPCVRMHGFNAERSNFEIVLSKAFVGMKSSSAKKLFLEKVVFVKR